MKTWARLVRAGKALLFNISLETRWQAEQGQRQTGTQCFLLNASRGTATTATRPPPPPLKSSTPNPPHAPQPPKRKIEVKDVCFLFLFLTESQQPHKRSLCIFTRSEIRTHTTAINSHRLQLCTLPREVAQRGILRVGLQLPGSHLHKEEIFFSPFCLFILCREIKGNKP